jgi:hypothetical protein
MGWNEFDDENEAVQAELALQDRYEYVPQAHLGSLLLGNWDVRVRECS